MRPARLYRRLVGPALFRGILDFGACTNVAVVLHDGQSRTDVPLSDPIASRRPARMLDARPDDLLLASDDASPDGRLRDRVRTRIEALEATAPTGEARPPRPEGWRLDLAPLIAASADLDARQLVGLGPRPPGEPVEGRWPGAEFIPSLSPAPVVEPVAPAREPAEAR